LTLFGAANKDQLLGRPVLERIHPDYHALVTQRVRQINDEEQDTPPIEETYLRFDGTPVAVAVSAVPVHYGGEHGALVFVRDITEQKEHEDRLKAIAYHDPLTKLPNRLLLGDRLQQAISQNQRTGTLIAVCYLDLDGFKEINDNFGHQTGDRVLVEVADRLQAAVRGGDTVARLGGDEFVLLLCGLLNEEECQVAVRRMVQAIAAPYQIGGHPQATISASIGITIFPNDHADPDTLVRHADHAMYSAKQAGKNRFHLFDTPLEQRIEARHAMLTRIEEALASQHFVLHYQPKFDCKNARIVGVEALIRWQHPTLGLLMPAAFLPMIEDDPLAISVGEWVIREALRQVVQWTQNGVDLQVSVNAFASQLIEGDFALQLEAILREYPGINPNHLQIEIVETAALEELDVVRRVIEDCAALGVGFALDDFGTGYSSLAYLRHLPAREIKIDQTFVRDMLEDADDQAIVEAVIGLGRAFRRTVVAEGAETSAHIARLLSLGCDIVQGYAIARPMSGTDIAKWIRDFKPDPNWGRPAPVIDEPF
jgi:diguanylate cyclase (GGDEF)-like protein/PAS domain S-box-containing protein